MLFLTKVSFLLTGRNQNKASYKYLHDFAAVNTYIYFCYWLTMLCCGGLIYRHFRRR
jgi:hypothetical protein